MKIFHALALSYFFVGCADPASLRVTVEVHEPNLAAIRVAVARNLNGTDKSLLSCTFPAGEKTADSCLLEGGSGRWDGDRNALTFILYGQPGSELVVGAAGLRTISPDAVATSTETSVRLPSAGEEGALNLSLVALTSVHAVCSTQLAATGNLDRSALAILDVIADAGGRPELLAATGTTLGVLQYQPVTDTCGLLAPTNFNDNLRACQFLENTLVTGPLDDQGGKLIAGVCAGQQVTNEELRILASPFDSQSVISASSTIARSNFSPPVIADLNGDGRSELYMLRAGRPLLLSGWRAGPRIENSLLELNGLQAYMPNNPGMNTGPLVVRDPRSGRDALIIAGYNGGLGVVTGGTQLRYTRFQSEVGVVTLGPAAVVTEDETFLKVKVAMLYGRELRVTVLEGHGEEWGMVEQYSHFARNDLQVKNDRNFRLAIGDVDGDGRLSAVTVQYGQAIIFPLDREGEVRDFAMWPNISEVQSVLLASLNGAPGAEIIAFDNSSNKIYAIDAAGHPLDGWPLEGPEGGVLRVILGELDPPNALVKNLEVIAQSQATVQVFSLGPGSYDADQLYWPTRDCDPGASSVLQSAP